MRISTATEARLRGLRLRLTALFTVTTAACLVALGTVAMTVDARSRQQALDSELDRRATGLSRAVWIDQDVLHLDPLREDTLAEGPAAVVVVELTPSGQVQLRYTGPATASVPGSGDLRAVAVEVARTEESLVDTVRTDSGRRVRMAASPVWGTDRVQAVVIVAGDPGIGDDQGQLLRWLIGGCLALIVVAGQPGTCCPGGASGPPLTC